jgi:hypothetical protein
MASEAAAKRTGADRQVETGSIDTVQCSTKDGALARTNGVTSTLCIPPPGGDR